MAAEPVSPDVATTTLTGFISATFKWSYIFPITCIAMSLKAKVGPW